MAPNTISPDDPRLTAYALGEMDPAERAVFELQLQHQPAARRTVEEIRATAAALTDALLMEAEVPELAAASAPIVSVETKGVPRLDAGPAEPGRVLPKTIKFPQFYYMVSGLAAACFAVFFVFWQKDQPAHTAKRYIEVPLTAAAPAASDHTAEMGGAAETPAAGSAQFKLLAKEEAFKDAAKVAERAQNEKGKSDAGLVRSRAERDQDSEAVIGGLALHQVAAAPAPAEIRGETETGREIGMVAPPASKLAGTRLKSATAPAPANFAPSRSDEPADQESYAYQRDNAFVRVADQPLSTFSVDVDTASYANVRRFVRQGQVPPVDAVRVEEMINYFPYAYAGPVEPPSRGDTYVAPFAANLEVASAPWAPEHRLVRIGLKGREVTEAARPPANLVFLIDVSGSMNAPQKLPLVKQALKLLLGKLRADDRVALAVYAGASGLALPSTPVAQRAEILDAIERLEAGGSTNGAIGIQLAYDIAKANFMPGGVNRVILATDGDFNVGVTSQGELIRLVQEKAKSGVFLSVLGFGMGNLKDSTLEQLADRGNGNYAYIDTAGEARKTLVEQVGGTLVTIAKDVKLQVEFNPAVVGAYRLIGYENRLLAKEDFNNDRVDAGEIGAGHTVTALYEVIPVGGTVDEVSGSSDDLKYQRPAPLPARGERPFGDTELLTLKVRYKDPGADVSRKLEFPLRDSGASFATATPDFKFASAVAAFGLVLRDSPLRGQATLTDIAAWARAGVAVDVGGYRSEFIDLVTKFGALVR